MAFNLWPYTNLHNTNLDWVISQIKMIKESLTRALQAAEEAENSADTASSMAENASLSAQNAALSSQNAAQSASNAATSAGQAQNYAEHISDPVSGLVTTWLENNITQETGYVIDDSLTVEGAAADAAATGRVKTTAEATSHNLQIMKDNLLDITQPYVKLTKNSSIFTVEDGYYATTGNKVALAGYILCTYTADIDFDLYADAITLAGTTALFVSIYNNSIASGNNVVCYTRNAQENTLPTESNKATVHAGQILAISIYTPSTNLHDFGIFANYKEAYTIKPEIDLPTKFNNFPYGKNVAWFGDSISELRQLPHTSGALMKATVYDCSIRGSTIGRTYSNYDSFSFYNLVTAIISGDFSTQFAQLDAYEQAQGHTYPGIRENLTTLSNLDFNDVDYVVLLQGTNDFGITAVHASAGYDNKVSEMQAKMDDAINRFITAYPKLKFYIISPPFRATPTEDYYGNTIADYIAAEQEVSNKYAIAFYNLLTNSRICDANKSTYMISDGGVYVHPNDYGDDWLAELISKFISTN